MNRKQPEADHDAPQPAPPEQSRMSAAQRRYLIRGLSQPGGKLPLFDDQGQQVARQTVEACIARGWAELWFANPVKPDWLVCRLTPAGEAALRIAEPVERSRDGN